MQLQDSVVVITGASSGLGRALALELAGRGSRLVLAARGATALENVSQCCRARGAETLVVVTDVTEERDVQHLVHSAVARWGRIDAWINNAGVTLYSQIEGGELANHRRVIETNVLGSLSCARSVMPVFRKQHQGVLINVGSVLSHVGQAFVPTYTVSKFGVWGLSEALRVEVADEPDIHVCTVFPYAIDTPHFQVAAGSIGRAAFALPPTQSPEKVARAIAKLCEKPRRNLYVPRWIVLGVALHAIAPKITERLLLDALRRWHLSHEPQPVGDGNLYGPAREPAKTHGDRPPRLSTASLVAWLGWRFVRNVAAPRAQ